MSDYSLEIPDAATVREIIAHSDTLLAQNPSINPERTADGGLEMGPTRYCMESSDAVTRAAHALGIAASREVLVGWHGITYFGDPGQQPSGKDVILCRTWGQYDPSLYFGDHVQSGHAFFGTRAELDALLPAIRDTFTPSGVAYRQTLHRAGWKLGGRHHWLQTTVPDLATGTYPMGEAAPGAYANYDWI